MSAIRRDQSGSGISAFGITDLFFQRSTAEKLRSNLAFVLNERLEETLLRPIGGLSDDQVAERLPAFRE
jgi:hypothetical protein